MAQIYLRYYLPGSNEGTVALPDIQILFLESKLPTYIYHPEKRK